VEVLPPFPEKLKSLEGKKVYLVPGTLRPETMYGQTNIWVLPEGDYGAFEINDTDVFICTERAARNMAFQGLSKTPGQVSCLAKFKGWDILGIPVKAPLAPFDKVYTLPMLTISPKKGTGIVTSVPSDSPDDYINLDELRRKPAWREKHNLKDEMVLPYEVVEIIDVPDYGTRAAQKACEELKIKSPKDKELLEEAKEKVYQKGFYEGKMIVGEHKGKLVRDAKPLIKEMLIATGQAVVYAEPASDVISRSGDECVVALTDQWYLDYGEPKWRAEVEK
jgi:leucyl-tRNA synthetase